MANNANGVMNLGLMNNYYGQSQNKDGSWNGVTIDNKPIDVEGYLPAPKPKRSVTIKKAPQQLQMEDSGRQASRAPYTPETGVIEPDNRAAETAVKAGKTTAEVLQAQDSDYRNAQKAMAGAGFLVDVINANNAYENAKGQAQINIMLARNSANDAIYRGRQAALERQSEGFQAGNDAELAMAAQGQDVRGHATQKLSGSYVAMGYENAAREEINAMREAMGYKLEEINYDYQRTMAGINRDVAIAGSALNAGVMMLAL